tara:strand:- start:12211 stop:12600 length:390 start_codon:yes stop_codon:yes gene_type:complete
MITSAVLLILYNAKENISYFYTPTELINSKIENEDVRLGGYVQINSFIKISAGSFEFKLTDNINSIKVFYKGILPDLFREGQGAVIEGNFSKENTFNAKNVFAKHDENYMPTSIKKELEDDGYWKKDYK